MTDKQKQLIKIAREWYKGNKSISDKEFDTLENEVKSEDPNFNYRLYLDLDGETVNHKVKFPELKKPQIDKYNLDNADTKKLLLGLENKGYLMTPKLSGCSLVEYYNEEGLLVDIITKSNDYNGKRKLSSFSNMVPMIVPKGIKAINTEAIVELDKGFGNSSEAKANGLVNSKYKGDEVASLITLVVWDIHLYEWCKVNKSEMFNKLRDYQNDHYKVVPDVKFSMDKLSWNSRYDDGNIKSIIDGYVIYSANHNLITALKFYFNESEIVKVKNIEWNLSDKLGLIPKIVFDPIKLDGHNVSKCAANGIENLKELNISVGSEVVVARVNSTIPQVVNVENATGFRYPKCPTCKTQLDDKCILKSVLYCSNPYCKDKINWLTTHVGNVNYEKLERNTDKYTIDAMNLSSFNKDKKRTHRWKDQDYESLTEFIKSEDTQGFYELLKAHFDLNNDNKKKCKLLIPALLKILNQKLN